MAIKLTDKIIRDATAPDRGSALIRDSEISGFALRITAAGVKAFIMDYRVRGTGIKRQATIGRYPAWTLAAARREAALLRQKIDRGGDPLGEEREERAEPTVKELAARYIAEWLPRKRASGQKRDGDMIEADILPALGKLKVKAVSYADIYALHRRVTERGSPIRANRVLACTSKMFSLAVVPWGMRADNPCRGIERNAEKRRDRFLAGPEIVRLVEALKAYPPASAKLREEGEEEKAERAQGRSAANCLLFLLLTGCRSGEAMGARWEQIDLGAGTWTKPAGLTKQARMHHIPLSGPVRQFLASIQPTDAKPADFVFPGRKPGEAIKQLRSCWETVTKAAGIEGARIHDLRHSYASVLASAGSSLPLIGRLLGHTVPITTARYAHLALDPLREATERASAIILAGESAEVVTLLRPGSKP